MSSNLITFGQVVAKAHTLDDEVKDKSAADMSWEQGGAQQATEPGGQSKPRPVEDGHKPSRDRDLAVGVSRAIAQLQEAMDMAGRAGLIVEPTFRTVGGRFNEFGISIDSHICSVEIYRKLA